MKIIQMNLDDFGIYHDISWNPPDKGLIVMHGHNESGKTTLMKYVRAMFFGYPRGEWRGHFGHMDIRRETGKEYRIFRNEKESYIEDGDTIIHDEPSALWWHGLERSTYDKIFAMGLEDLQGFKILSNEAVRSHFFSVEGGVAMGLARQDIHQAMSDLLVASPQGKKPINALLQEQKDFDGKIAHMAYDEDEFAALQEKERQTHDIERRLRITIAETKQQIEKVSMPLAAWDIYQRGQDAMKHMQFLADVAQFPADGVQRWTEIETKLKTLDETIVELEEESRKGPAFKPEWKRWVICGPQLEDLYGKVAEWKQSLLTLSDHADKEIDWQYDANAYKLKLQQWTGGDIPERVDWPKAVTLARSLERYSQEEEKWQAARPKNVSPIVEQEQPELPAHTKEEWQELGKSVVAIQEKLLEREKIQGQLSLLEQEPEKKGHTYMALAFLFFAGALAALGAIFYYDVDTMIGGIVAAAGAILGMAFFIKRNSVIQYRPRQIEELSAARMAVENRLKDMAAQAHLSLTLDDDTATWNKALDKVRKQYMDWKTTESKEAWNKEQKIMYDAIYEKWQSEGKDWSKKVENCRKAWEGWQNESGFTNLSTEQVQEAKDAWDAYEAVVRSHSEWSRTKESLMVTIKRYGDTAEQLFREVGVSEDVSPEGVERIYQEWQHIRVQSEVAREQDRQRDVGHIKLLATKKEREGCLKQQQDLLKECGASTAGEFRSKVLQFRQFHQYKEVYEQSESHIRLIAKNPKNLSTLRHELKVHDKKTWLDEKAYYEKKIDETEKKLAQVAQERGTYVERLSQMAKSEEYNNLLQAQQNRRTVLDEGVDQWLAYVYAQYIIGEAQTYYERVRQPLVIRKAGEYLHLMTQGRYTLQASFDGKELYTVDGTGRRIPEKQWSSGTGDQVYLAIRMSLAMAFSKQIEPMPLILDDILVRFDEKRQHEAIRFLADLGRTEQVFLFTCSQETARIAKDVQDMLKGETDTIHLFEIEQGHIKEA